MMIQDSIIGVLFVHQHECHDFSENEKQMISLFANQAALAIQNAQQREEAMTEIVAWTGIQFASLGHRITQKVYAIRNIVYGSLDLLKFRPISSEFTASLKDIDRIASIITCIPNKSGSCQ